MMTRDTGRDLSRAALLPATQVRLDETLRRYLVVVARRDDISMSQAIRDRLYAALDREPAVRVSGAGGHAVPFRMVIDEADDEGINDLAEQLREGTTSSS